MHSVRIPKCGLMYSHCSEWMVFCRTARVRLSAAAKRKRKFLVSLGEQATLLFSGESRGGDIKMAGKGLGVDMSEGGPRTQ